VGGRRRNKERKNARVVGEGNRCPFAHTLLGHRGALLMQWGTREKKRVVVGTDRQRAFPRVESVDALDRPNIANKTDSRQPDSTPHESTPGLLPGPLYDVAHLTACSHVFDGAPSSRAFRILAIATGAEPAEAYRRARRWSRCCSHDSTAQKPVVATEAQAFNEFVVACLQQAGGRSRSQILVTGS
jgi:hypothetical protein